MRATHSVPCGNFAIHLDELTGNTNMAYILFYVRCIHNRDINGGSLICQPLPERTPGIDIFQKANDFFHRRLQWKYCWSVYRRRHRRIYQQVF